MSSQIDAQNHVQSPSQANPASDALPAPPAVPEQTQQPPPAADNNDFQTAKARKKQRNKELCALSKTYGNIPNVPIFTVWGKRQECSDAAVHRSIMAGICGNSKQGAFSIALSCLYKDDEDGGDVIIYTGSGGRERWTNTFPPKRLRLGPQTRDQSWDDPPNKALMVSFLTGNPVRVIRSWRCPSQYAPAQGYRYDGLYTVAAYWTAKGRNGKNICRCRLERLPDQPPIPERTLTFSTSRRRRRERLVSRVTPGPPPYAGHYDIPGEDVGCNQQQQATPMPQTSAENNSNMDVDPGVREGIQPLPEHGVTPNPDGLPRFKWDSKQGKLVKISSAVVGGEEEVRAEDDALTLVPSEDGRHVIPANERAGTEYFSDRGDSPPPAIPEPDEVERVPGSPVLENQGDL